MSSETEALLGGHARTQCLNSNRSDFNQNFKKWFHVIFNLELAMALHAFAYGIHGVIVTNLYIEKACRVNLNFSRTICDNINDYDSEQTQVQIVVSTLELYSILLSSIPCIFVSMMLGAWSDKNGRKPILIIPSFGGLLCQVVYILNVYFPHLRAEYLMFSNLYSLFGGYTAQMMATYSYLAETTSPSTRTTRIAIFHVLSSIGYTIGNFLSPYLYQGWGFYGTFGSTLVIAVISMLFLLVFIKEPGRTETETLDRRQQSERPLTSMKEAARSVLKRRPGERRRVILLLLSIMLLLVASMSGGGGGYLFTRKMFHWDEMIYTEVRTVMTILSTACNLLLLPFLSFTLGIPDHIIGVMATMSYFSDLVVTALAQTGRSYIFAACLGLMGSQSSMVIRSLLSKLVPKSDLGKVYSMLGSLENIIPLVFSPILTYTYNSTLDTFPGAVYAVSACITGIAVICFGYVSFLVERNPSNVLDLEETQGEL